MGRGPSAPNPRTPQVDQTGFTGSNGTLEPSHCPEFRHRLDLGTDTDGHQNTQTNRTGRPSQLRINQPSQSTKSSGEQPPVHNARSAKTPLANQLVKKRHAILETTHPSAGTRDTHQITRRLNPNTTTPFQATPFTTRPSPEPKSTKTSSGPIPTAWTRSSGRSRGAGYQGAKQTGRTDGSVPPRHRGSAIGRKRREHLRNQSLDHRLRLNSRQPKNSRLGLRHRRKLIVGKFGLLGQERLTEPLKSRKRRAIRTAARHRTPGKLRGNRTGTDLNISRLTRRLDQRMGLLAPNRDAAERPMNRQPVQLRPGNPVLPGKLIVLQHQ